MKTPGPMIAILIAKGSIESTHKVPTSRYHTEHCHAAARFH